jgi:hypothetical protein
LSSKYPIIKKINEKKKNKLNWFIFKKKFNPEKLKKFKYKTIANKFIKKKKPPILGTFFLCNFLIPSGLSNKAIFLERFLKKYKKNKFNMTKKEIRVIIFY